MTTIMVKRIIECTLTYAEHKKSDKSVVYQRYMAKSFTKSELFSYIGSLR